MYKYIYGKDVESEEHMLFSVEIAEIYKIYKAYENKGLHGQLITQVIKDYIAINNLDSNDYHYNTRYGARKVYPGDVYINAIIYLLDNSTMVNGISYYISLNKKKYRYERG